MPEAQDGGEHALSAIGLGTTKRDLASHLRGFLFDYLEIKFGEIKFGVCEKLESAWEPDALYRVVDGIPVWFTSGQKSKWRDEWVHPLLSRLGFKWAPHGSLQKSLSRYALFYKVQELKA